MFLDFDSDRIKQVSNDFELLRERNYDETTLSFLLADTLVLRDHWVKNTGPEALTTLRRDKWRPRKRGPEVSNIPYTFDWDIEPDVTYGISFNMFSRERRSQLTSPKGLPLLADHAGICPYLTIEYKSMAKGGNETHARNQIAAASMIWLTQWYEIKRTIGADSSDFKSLKHYSIALLSDNFRVWETCYDGVSFTFRCLWNGLGPHAAAFKKDAEKYLDLEVQRGRTTSMDPPPLPSSS